MAEEHLQRKLTTIFAADVEGFARHMREDEEATLKSLIKYREIIDGLIARHEGRIFSIGGDSVMAEFGSPVEAVRCAISCQKEVASRNAGLADHRKLMFRIGVNVGDIMVKGDNLFGDGVNVAARLEGLAEAGGVCISGSVYEQVRHKLQGAFEDMGPQNVKNIAEPISVFRAIIDERADSLLSAERLSVRRRGLRPLLMASGLAVFVFIGGLFWWQPWSSSSGLASVENMVLPLPDKPSLAVLPFINLSDDPNQEIFVDGLTEDLITDLSKIAGLFVIASNSTSVYKDKPAEVRTVSETLGVRYVLEGSVRRDRDQLRVNAQLIDATTGRHLWADRFDREVTNIFVVQDEFVLKIVEALAVELSENEKSGINRGKTDDIEAREAFQRGWKLYSNFNAEDNAKAEDHLQKAIELDPDFGRAHAALALVYYRGYRFNWEQEMGESWNGLRKLTADTLKIAKQHPTPLVHVVAAFEYVNRGLPEQARVEAEQAIEMQPNDPEAHIAMAFAMIIAGRPWEGLSSVRTAMRLNPRYPSSYKFAEGIAHFAIGNLEEAAIVLEESHARDPKATELLPVLASVFAQLERRQDARDTVLKWKPGLSQLELQFLPDEYQFPVRWSLEHRRVRERLIDGLRVAVLPLGTSVSSLREELKIAKPFDRPAIIRTIGWFGPSAAVAVPDLIQALGDEQQQIRVEAAIALGKIGTEAGAAIPVLASITDDIAVSFHAKEALKEIIGN